MNIKEEIAACNGDCSAAAEVWERFGFSVFPQKHKQKKPAVHLDKWFEGSPEFRNKRHWERHPDHDVAARIDDSYFVLDADSYLAEERIKRVEREHGISSNLVLKTQQGYHHYYGLEDGVQCRTQSFDSKKDPAKIDVKSVRSNITLAPSYGKEIVVGTARTKTDLVKAQQGFVDTVFFVNESKPPRERMQSDDNSESNHGDLTIQQLEQLLDPLDPDESYDDWTRMGMALHSATGSGDEGLELFDRWSSRGDKYKGRGEIEYKWRSFGSVGGNSVTAASLIHMAREHGVDVGTILNTVTFEPVEDEAVENSSDAVNATHAIPFHRHSMRGLSAEMKQNSMDEVYVLQGIALLAQFTLLFGPPNIGKTLLLLMMLKEAIKAGWIDPDKAIYVNEDDNLNGLITKNEIAEQLGIHMLSSGYRDFQRKDLGKLLQELMDNSNCAGVVLILDTAKKFVNVMDKAKSSAFANLLRQFVKMGGTVILLAHTNKRPNKDGTNIPGGTSDLLDDADAGYVLNIVENDDYRKRRVVEFTEVKSRGGQEHCNTFQYSTAKGISYQQRLDSVERLTDERQQAIESERLLQADQAAIDAITLLIQGGTNTKMDIVKNAALTAGISQAQVKTILDRYNDHLWTFRTAERGKQIFTLINKD